MKKSKNEIKAMITPEMIKAAETLCMAKAFTQMVRPIVEVYSKEILVRHQFKNLGDKALFERLHNNGRHMEDQYVEEVILDRNQTYRMSDSDFAIYEKERQEACAKSGLKVEHPEFCPLLVAENLEGMAEGAFVDAMSPVTKIEYQQAFCSKDGMKAVKKLVDLSLGLIASLGMLKNPLKKAA